MPDMETGGIHSPLADKGGFIRGPASQFGSRGAAGQQLGGGLADEGIGIGGETNNGFRKLHVRNCMEIFQEGVPNTRRRRLGQKCLHLEGFELRGKLSHYPNRQFASRLTTTCKLPYAIHGGIVPMSRSQIEEGA